MMGSSILYFQRTDYDRLGRVHTVTLPDGSLTTTDYSNNTVTTSDASALARNESLCRAQHNVTFVNQGVQQRRFVYDSLSRLREAYNPEQVNSSGVKIATFYQYDDASNLITRTNPNGTAVGFEYDGLNRLRTNSIFWRRMGL